MKILIYVILILLSFTNFSNADVEIILKEIKKNKDLVMGFKNVKFLDGSIKNNWEINNSDILKSEKKTRKHVLKIVNKADDYPVRLGKQSLRFEVRHGNGWGWDKKNDRERVELKICCINKKITWTAWSIYLPTDYNVVFPIRTMLGQFHNDGDNPPAFTFENQGVLIPGGYWLEVDSYVGGNNNNPKLLIDQKDMLGKWTDVLVNAKWTNKKDGFFKVWVNGKLKAKHTGMTQEKIDDMLFHIGIYRSFLSKTPGPDPTQVAYYDEVRHGNKCKKLKLKELGYSCKDIESQTFK